MTGAEEGGALTANELAVIRSMIEAINQAPDKRLALLLADTAKAKINLSPASLEERLQNVADQLFYVTHYMTDAMEEVRRRLQCLEENVGLVYEVDGRPTYPKCKAEVPEVERNVLSRLLYLERLVEYQIQLCGGTLEP